MEHKLCVLFCRHANIPPSSVLLMVTATDPVLHLSTYGTNQYEEKEGDDEEEKRKEGEEEEERKEKEEQWRCVLCVCLVVINIKDVWSSKEF